MRLLDCLGFGASSLLLLSADEALVVDDVRLLLAFVFDFETVAFEFGEVNIAAGDGIVTFSM